MRRTIIVPFGVLYSQKFSYLCPNIIYMIMRCKIISLALLSMMTLVSQADAMPIFAGHSPKANIEELIERRRWGDARLSLMEYRQQLDEVANRYELEWVDYQLVCCQVELGSEEAERHMMAFMERYPQSQHANRMLFMLGCYHAEVGDLEAAEKVFQSVDYLGLNAREKERYDIRMGYIRFVQGDYLTATSRFSKIPQSSDYYGHALYYISYIEYMNGRYDIARAGFEQLKNHDSYRSVVPYYLLQIEYRERNYDYVVSEGERLLAVSTKSVRDDLLRIVAESYFVKGDYVMSLKYINDYPADKHSRQENYIKGYSLYRLGRYREAISPLRTVCGAMDGLTQNASYHLAECYLNTGDLQSATSAFSMASTDGFDDQIAENALLNYGRLKFELDGDVFNESINVLKRYLDKYPTSEHCPEVQTLLIAAYYNSKDYGSAYAAIKAFPNPDKELRMALQKVAVFRAVDAVKEGNYDLAQSLLEEAELIGISPKYKALAIYWQGEIAMLKGEYEGAKQKYEIFIRLAPKSDVEYLMAHYGMGYAMFQMKDMESAAVAFDTFVRDYPQRDCYMYDAHNRLGDTRFSQRQFNAARKAYKVALSSPSAERNYARYQLALIDGVESNSDAKIDKLKSIVADAEGDYVDDAWYELGRTYIALERFSDGVSTLEEFVSHDTTSPYYINALSDIGLAYYNLGRKDDARTYYEKVVAYDPQSPAALEAMRGIREIYVSEGDIDAYFKYAERSGVQSDMGVAARDSLTFAAARAVYLDGDVPKALTKLRAYLDDFDSGYNRSEALFYLSDCYIRNGDVDYALQSMEELVEHGSSQYVERVLTTMAPMCYDMAKYEKSAAAYRKLYDVAHDVVKRQEASDGYVDATMQYASDDLLMTMADDVFAMTDASADAKRKAQLVRGRVLYSRGSDEAYTIFAELANNRTTAEGTEAYYRLIEQRYNLGELDAAEQMVYDLGDCGSVYWQAKCFLLLGDIMLKNDNAFQARATYQSIVDGYPTHDDGIIDEAHQRINSMK